MHSQGFDITSEKQRILFAFACIIHKNSPRAFVHAVAIVVDEILIFLHFNLREKLRIAN